LAHQLAHLQRFSGRVTALELAEHGDILMPVLWTALSAEQPKPAAKIEFLSVPVDRQTSVR
jgi:hypothetical protein